MHLIVADDKSNGGNIMFRRTFVAPTSLAALPTASMAFADGQPKDIVGTAKVSVDELNAAVCTFLIALQNKACP